MIMRLKPHGGVIKWGNAARRLGLKVSVQDAQGGRAPSHKRCQAAAAVVSARQLHTKKVTQRDLTQRLSTFDPVAEEQQDLS